MNTDPSIHSSIKVVIHLDHLIHNYKEMRRLCGTPAMGILKADAYGHGLLPCAWALLKAGAPYIGVGIVPEAVFARKNGVNVPILSMLGPLNSAEAAQAVEHDITSLTATPEQLKMLAAQAGPGKKAKVALKFDTGMARLGFGKDDLAGLMEMLRSMPNIEPDLVMSHLAVADEPQPDQQAFTNSQVETFLDIAAQVKSVYPQAKASLNNSAGTMGFAKSRLDLVRPGISLYGNNPFFKTPQEDLGKTLKLVMEVSTTLVQVHPLKSGQSISYGRTFTAPKDMTVGIAVCGYADGYGRSLTNRGQMLIHGRRVPIVGRVCMQLTAVDLSAVPEAKAGDTVHLLGGADPNAITDWEIANWRDTIPHEVFCLMGDLNAREFTGMDWA